MLVEDSSKYDKVVANGARYSIPKKTRKLSLDEETLSKNMAHVAPMARHRGVMFVLNGIYFMLNRSPTNEFLFMQEYPCFLFSFNTLHYTKYL